MSSRVDDYNARIKDPLRQASDGVSSHAGYAHRSSDDPRALIQLYKRAVVLEVLGDPAIRNQEFVDSITENFVKIRNEDDIVSAPRNSLLVRVTENGEGRTNDEVVVVFPFFSSHIALPVKPGETVWIMYLTPQEPSTRAYWMTRVCDKDYVEDVNFTHHDRRHDITEPAIDDSRGLLPSNTRNGLSEDQLIPTDQESKDGDDAPDASGRTLREQDAFKKIKEENAEKDRFVIEPVPRITKQPGDLVLQGSNNTAIILGTDGGFGTNRPDGKTSLAAKPAEILRGTIDIVTGRGREYELTATSETSDPKGTRTRIVKNADGDLETDKNIATIKDKFDKLDKSETSNLIADVNEGDPDFINDASRIYVSSKTNVDANFGITTDNVAKGFEAVVKDVVDKAAIVVKSDEVRIIARKSGDKLKDHEYEDAAENFNGSIRIIKEGDPKKDGAAIIIFPDGTVQISGSKIFFGRTGNDEGADAGEGPGNSEPYMKYSEFNKWAGELMTAIESEFDLVYELWDGLGNQCLTPVGATMAASATPGFGGPDVAVANSGGTISGYAGGLLGNVAGARPMLGQNFSAKFGKDGSATVKIKSERVFGE